MAEKPRKVGYDPRTDEIILSDGSRVNKLTWALGKLEVRQEVWRDDQWHRDGVVMRKVYR